jgi:hypothetical protein
MPYCGFCGKNCPTMPGLKRHIDGTPACKKASHEEFGQYAKSIWNNIPDNPQEQSLPNDQSPLVTPQPEPDFPDIHLEEDIQAAGAMLDEETDLPPAPQPFNEQQLRPYRATVEDAPDDDETNQDHYIEEFPKETLAGATWGTSQTLFESLNEEQKKERNSHWGPFEDEDEWELAEWLIQNVGQKQTDAFLKLPIVRIFCSKSRTTLIDRRY